MKKLIALFILIVFSALPIVASNPHKGNLGYPQGTFKKNWKGEYVQYNKQGKKIGTYKTTKIQYGKIK